ncbi:MAG: hemerythrin domain-containing protein [Betaproteobacteria bacterium]|uniref:hemerythrin domain-containing protein n=1 Tax=Thiomonas TaxID=32012 RepID=UPI001AC818F5|nr:MULTISPECIES: hemerythrin domain-containing protein [Thiomonas]MBN8777038.1 hemerythrin domain-containing protein [Thiomonas arsenitoxydans]MDE1977883.1 hemerythrin domain-containing protein [Betaproteobacteria bacterium]MDE2267509.1 hemerythrin domain-containing protein [Betaproteobacteria bacterium]HML80663.1 hemerythrin domain-containing protein [Thiomonas arsenitoxydans]
MLLSDDLSAAGFDQPFELLRGCHARITRMDALLLRLIDHVALKETQGRPKFPCSQRGAGRRADPGGAQEGTDAQAQQAQQAAGKVLRYFDVAAPLHHEDEELHVFPLLRVSAEEWDGDDAVLETLESDHRTLAVLWAELRDWLLQVKAAQALPASAPITDAAQRFSALHAAHIAIENTQIFPAAQARMNPAQISAMGQDMAARRGVRWPPD